MLNVLELNPSVPKTLVIQPLPGIGDMVWHVRALKAIANTAQDTKVSVLAHPKSQAQALLGHEPYIDEIHYLNPKSDFGIAGTFLLAQKLRRLQISRIWILHHSARYLWSSLLAGIPEREGYGFGSPLLTSSLTLSKTLRKYSPLERMAAFFKGQSVDLETISPLISMNPAAYQQIKSQFDHLPQPWIALGAGATELKRLWPIEHFQDLIRTLQLYGTIFVCGVPSEAARIQNIVKTTQAIPLTHLPLAQTCALIGQCAFFVGNDSGLLNIAASLGVASLGLFGVSPPLTYVSTLQSITSSKERGDAEMKDISVQAVLDRLDQLKLITFPRN